MSKTVTPQVTQPTTPIRIPHDKIAMRAYEKWCQRGRPCGSQVQDWLEAERELQTEFSRTGTPNRR